MKRRFPSLVFAVLSVLSLASSQQVALQETALKRPPSLVGNWSGSLGAERRLSLSLTASGPDLLGEATLPALGWMDAGRYQVRGQVIEMPARSGQLNAELKLTTGGKWAYDMTCQPTAELWNCTLETWRGGDRSSTSRAWRTQLGPVR